MVKIIRIGVLLIALAGSVICFGSAFSVQRALTLSKQAAHNITAAHEACDEWEGIFRQTNFSSEIRETGKLLHAACLVRVGRDTDALNIYQKCTNNSIHSSRVNLQMAACWQRLMQYDKAYDFYTRENADYEAMTCQCRLGNYEEALLAAPDEWKGLLEFLVHNKPLGNSSRAMNNPVLALVTNQSLDHFSVNELRLINVGPWDDHRLIRLDDKIHLHELLDNATFWPESYELPQPRELVSSQQQWIVKQRAGYGSHGNVVLKNIDEMPANGLLQKLIPSLQIHDQRFSLRIYVLMLGGGSKSWVSRRGLVKLSDDIMTNSGRTPNAVQHELTWLRKHVQDYSLLWSHLVETCEEVLTRYYHDHPDKCRLVSLGIPKILGFDFVVDKHEKPWLVEVNRFPGLEHRNIQDEAIKSKVVEDAWNIAQMNRDGQEIRLRNWQTLDVLSPETM